METILIRFTYADNRTEGDWTVGDKTLATIERPWIRHTSFGGKPRESCIPDGRYTLVPFTRPNGSKVYALRNHELGVFVYPDDRPDGLGRSLVLIHVGNYVTDVVGCIAPGLARTYANGKFMVTNSKNAMEHVDSVLGWQDGHSILIQPAQAVDDHD